MANEDRDLLLGPFGGGLNTYSQSGAIADNEVVVCNNLVPDVDGSLKCRPPLVRMLDNPGGFLAKNVDAVGSGIILGVNYVFFSNESGVWKYDGVTLTLISPAGVYSQSCIQYKNEMYFIAQPNSAQPGGKWDGAGWTSLPVMPKGQSAVIYKERMWIAPGKHAFSNPSRLYFSNVADPGLWTVGTDFFDITPGDGSNLVDLRVVSNNLLVFKQGSTFYLSYDARPADATIVKISNTIGSSNWRCIAEIRNDLYVMHETGIYQLVNFNWVKVNTKVPFIPDYSVPVGKTRDVHTFICQVGDFLVCRYHNNIYCYNAITQTWSTWSSLNSLLHNFGPLIQMPAEDLFSQNNAYYSGSGLAEDSGIYRILDGYDTVTVESLGGAVDIECSVLTKSYSFNLPWKFKRLYSWALECTTNRVVVGTAYPFSISNPASVVTTTPATGGVVLKRAYRFPKGLRFREIQFGALLLSSGATTDGLAQVYTVMASVKVTQTVTKNVN